MSKDKQDASRMTAATELDAAWLALLKRKNISAGLWKEPGLVVMLVHRSDVAAVLEAARAHRFTRYLQQPEDGPK